jgi:hypothetical protein
MTRLRIGALSALVALVAALGFAGTASAQDDPPALTQQVAIAGKNKGKDFTGTYTIKRFVASGSKVYAVGTLKGTLKNRKVTRSNVRIPAAVSVPASSSQVPPNPTEGACQILDLVLNPLDLNLLGLHVVTSRIELLIEAIPGQNALLGNLLCAITGLLDPQDLPTGTTLSQVLNSLLALLPRTA